jgi:pimeloyl-ACP methyl ester carboxylesterase
MARSPRSRRSSGSIRYDARGLGRSGKPATSFAFFEDLRALLRLLEIERACLMGCSGRGATIIDLALADPEMVAALVLVDSGLFRYPFAEQPPPKLLELRAAWECGDLDAPSSSPCRNGPTGSAGVRSRSTPRPVSARGR